MRVAIVGAGAVGGVFGAMLARAGHAVSLLTRGDSLEAVRARGLSLTNAAGEVYETGPLAASDDPAALGVADLVLVAVKSWQVAALAPALAPLVGPGTLVVPVQNGVEAGEALLDGLGPSAAHAVAFGVCHVLASRDRPGHVRSGGGPPQLTVGEPRGGPSPRLERLADALRAAGIVVVISPEIRVELWGKLLFVEPLGSVGAVTGVPMGVMRSVPETRALLEQAMGEVLAVAAGQGVRLPGDPVAAALARVDGMPASATTSMHRDLLEGRPSELDEQTGAVVRLGHRAGVACPVHDVLYACLLPRHRASASRA